MSDGRNGVLLAVVVLVLGSVGMVVTGRRAAEGSLAHNHLVGVRTPATLTDDETWSAAHAASGRLLAGTGWAGVGLGVLALLLDLGGAGEPVLAAVVLLAAGVLTIGCVAAGVRGDRAAKVVLDDRQDR